jgi:ABC-type transport system substrate-binding protein
MVVTLLVPQGSPGIEDAGRAVAFDLAAVGIASDVSARPLAEIEDRILRGDFDLAIVPERADDPLASTERYRGAVSAWFDALADAAREAEDRAEKRVLYGELQRLWTELPPAVPLYQILKVDVVPARSAGMRPASHGAPLTWNAGEWTTVRGR